MAAPLQHEFEDWLSKKLLNLNAEVDLEIFVSYIISILETETTDEDKQESLVGFLAELTEDDIEGHSQEVLERWQRSCGEVQTDNKEVESSVLVDQFHSIVEQQQKQKVVTKTVTKEQKERKSAILAQYGHISGGEESEEEEEGAVADLSKNINTISVSGREQELRERMKQNHENKKQKDKEDRDKQKQKVVDRKDSEKKRTAKGEKRR